MPRYIDKWTGNEVEITCLAPATASAVLKVDGVDTIISQEHMNDRYEIVVPQVIQLEGHAGVASGAR